MVDAYILLYADKPKANATPKDPSELVDGQLASTIGTSLFNVKVGVRRRVVDILYASHVRKVPSRMVLLASYTKRVYAASTLMALGRSPKI